MNIEDVRELLSPLANPSDAEGMKAYMRGQFEFLGLKTPIRREATKQLLKQLPKKLDHQFVRDCWAQPEREFQYIATDYIRRAQLTHDDLPLLAELVTTHSWWDTVDSLAKAIGSIATTDDMQAWSRTDNLWLRRVSVIHQLGRKEDTDAAFLHEMIQAASGTGEFFLNKAIGWALRDYAHTNPRWVRQYLQEHGDNLAPLARREASKHL